MKLQNYKQEYDKLNYKKNLSGKKALEAVKQNGYALLYVKEQTEDICLEAVKQDGYALPYVKEQTENICLEAVKQNGYALLYVSSDIFEEDNFCSKCGNKLERNKKEFDWDKCDLDYQQEKDNSVDKQ